MMKLRKPSISQTMVKGLKGDQVMGIKAMLTLHECTLEMSPHTVAPFA